MTSQNPVEDYLRNLLLAHSTEFYHIIHPHKIYFVCLHCLPDLFYQLANPTGNPEFSYSHFMNELLGTPFVETFLCDPVRHPITRPFSGGNHILDPYYT